MTQPPHDRPARRGDSAEGVHPVRLGAAREFERSAATQPDRSVRTWVWRGLLMAVSALVLYGLLPRMVDLWSRVPQLQSIGWAALGVVAVLQFASWWCSAELDRVALPGATRFVVITTSLASNAISRVVPGAGGALGVGLSYRMWTESGFEVGTAASAVAATTVISLGTLFVLPVVTLAFALIGAPTPRSLVWVALGGAVAFVVLFGVGVVLLFTNPLLRWGGRLVERAARRLHRDVTASGIEQERDRLRVVLGARWQRALASSVGIWAFDYLSLVAVLVALHTNPQPSVVLLAFTAAKILGMVPLTPGGLGIVEAGLTGMLTLAGIPAPQALLATLAYRIVSYWLALPAGLVAWLMFRRRFPAVEQAVQ
jgi:uncharacterized protein (TIRG00374 family)